MGACRASIPSSDQPMASVHSDMVLVAMKLHGDIHRLARLWVVATLHLGFAELQAPVRRAIPLADLGRPPHLPLSAASAPLLSSRRL